MILISFRQHVVSASYLFIINLFTYYTNRTRSRPTMTKRKKHMYIHKTVSSLKPNMTFMIIMANLLSFMMLPFQMCV